MKLNLYTNNMERQELLELVASLNAKNMALEEEIKRLEKQTDRLIKEWNDEEDERYYPSEMEEARDVLDEIERQDYEANCIHEKDVELNQKLNSINSRLNGTNSRVVDLENRMAILEEKEGDNDKCV